jgi:hypothetical protein
MRRHDLQLDWLNRPRGHAVSTAAQGWPGPWLSLAAAPTFAAMALLAGIHGSGMPAMLCAAAPDASPLNGMVPMYLLMSAFHLPPWLRLLSRL